VQLLGAVRTPQDTDDSVLLPVTTTVNALMSISFAGIRRSSSDVAGEGVVFAGVGMFIRARR
jgi:hypothetical protein